MTWSASPGVVLSAEKKGVSSLLLVGSPETIFGQPGIVQVVSILSRLIGNKPDVRSSYESG